MHRHRQRTLALAMLLNTLAVRSSAQSVAPCEAYWNAAAVFIGRVDSVRRQGTTRTLSLSVVESFHGVSSSHVDAVLVVPRASSCLTFNSGSEFVFYADKRPTDGAWLVNACGRTRPIDDAAADVDYARAVRQGTAPAGYVTGHVSVGYRTIAGKPIAFVGTSPAVTVALVQGDLAVGTTTTSDAAGWYRIDSPGAGTYRVNVAVPDGFYLDGPPPAVTLRDARACASADVALYDDGHVNGRVVDAKGRAVAGLTLELTAAGGGAGIRTVTDREGRYAWTRVPAGRFLLTVPAEPSRTSEPRLHFPGRITLGAGERKTLADFGIPAQRGYVSVSGVVLDAAGVPAEGARIFLKGAGDGARIVSEPVFADFMGRFVIAARAGAEYGVFAERPRAGGRAGGIDATATVRVIAAEGLAPVRLVLERRY